MLVFYPQRSPYFKYGRNDHLEYIGFDDKKKNKIKSLEFCACTLSGGVQGDRKKRSQGFSIVCASFMKKFPRFHPLKYKESIK